MKANDMWWFHFWQNDYLFEEFTAFEVVAQDATGAQKEVQRFLNSELNYRGTKMEKGHWHVGVVAKVTNVNQQLIGLPIDNYGEQPYWHNNVLVIPHYSCG